MTVLALAGSLRQGSYNRGLIDAARQLAPVSMIVVPFDLAGIPLYNADLDSDELRPAEVVRLKALVAEADGLLIATPEYNHSVPGVLQNALDWVSRPGNNSPLKGKPVAIMGASTGAVGSARAQQQLKLVMMSTMSLIMPHPGLVVGHAREKFDAAGTLTHQPTRQFLGALLREFEAWTARFV
jgi:chromate reductase